MEKSLTAALLGENIAGAHIHAWINPNELEEIIAQYSLPENHHKTYLALSSLYFFAYIRASQQDSVRLQPDIIENTSHNLSSFLIVEYLNHYDVAAEPDVVLYELNDLTRKLIGIWDANIDNEPSPHWFVGKELNFYLKTEPDPALISLFSELLTKNTIAIMQFLEEVQEKYEVTI